MPRPHRITVYRDSGGKRWRYRVQAGNNWVVDDPERSFKSKLYATYRAKRRWRGSILVVQDWTKDERLN